MATLILNRVSRPAMRRSRQFILILPCGMKPRCLPTMRAFLAPQLLKMVSGND